MKRLVEIDDATHVVVPRKVTPEIVRAWNGGDADAHLPASATAECQADMDRIIAASPAIADAQAVPSKALIDNLRSTSTPTTRWYVFNADETGYVLSSRVKHEMFDWLERTRRENPAYVKHDGLHVVEKTERTIREQLMFDAAEALSRAALSAAAGDARLPIAIEALQFYADNKHWYEGMECFGGGMHLRECGDKAKTALAAIAASSKGICHE